METELRGGRGLSQADRYIYLEKKLKQIVRAFESFPEDEELEIDKDFLDYVIKTLNYLRSWLKSKNAEERIDLQKRIVKGSKKLYNKYSSAEV